MRFREFLIAASVLGVASQAAPVAVAAEPQVQFELKDGWVEFVLTQDDRPVPNAVVQVFDDRGNKFAEGETGAQGRGVFPLPPEIDFRVEIKVGDRTADIIRLVKIEDHVVPNRVLLSFGLAPCCRVPVQGGKVRPPSLASSDAFSFSLPPWVQTAGSYLLVVIVLAVLVAKYGSPSTNRNRRSRNG